MSEELWIDGPEDEFIRGARLAAAPIPPMHKAKRRHITGDASYILTDAIMLHEVQTELQRISGKNFEIIYDVATTTDCIRPGHHVYQIVRPGGAPSEDVLVLEFSCKHDFEKVWHPDNARPPGWWIVEHFKARDRARMSRAEEEVVDKEFEVGNQIVKDVHNKQKVEKQREFAEAVDMKARKGRVSRRFDGVKSGT